MTAPESKPAPVLSEGELRDIARNATVEIDNGFCEPECDAADCIYHRVAPNTLRLLDEHAAMRERVAELEKDLHWYKMGSAIEAREADAGRSGIAQLKREAELLRAALATVQAREACGLRAGMDARAEAHEQYDKACDAAREALDAVAKHDASKPGAGEG